ncbi:Glutamyl-tRNA reductase [Candidatus Ichthyocystis hellenicum]|uniref:Glutamyl-tRNA reductase n=2 Tax=Burkholderiales genera incertae sedis TaxID=224471 RepID=A0A0S4M453_9BURK|nr:Glutamyl-tRNA reductase [Candidatus Ichthyocystis hellenicum]
MLRTASISYQSAPVSFRERVSFKSDEIVSSIRELTSKPGISEAAIISTCNRTEIYIVSREDFDFCSWLSRKKCIEPDEMSNHIIYRNGINAVKHVFRVASSLDSIVIGESQILGQLKKAALLSQSSNGCKTVLHRLFHGAFSTAKEVRSSTGIGRNVISTAAGAAYLVENVFSSIKDQNVLFIGGGEIINLCMTHFHSRSPKSMGITNRTAQRVTHLVDKFKAHEFPLDEIENNVHLYDVIVSGITSPQPIISQKMMNNALAKRKNKPVVIVDLSVPRSIERLPANNGSVYVYTVDDLSNFVKSGIAARCSAIQLAEKIVDKNIEVYQHWLRARESVGTIRTLRERNYHIAVKEGQRAVRRLQQGASSEVVIRNLCQKIVNKILHHPTKALRDNIRFEKHTTVDIVAKIFDIENNT